MIRTNPTSNWRQGVTLTEVLVAIFIMGIGLLSLLVLFPLGALQMAQAIRDDRCTHAGINARALADTMIPYTTSNNPNHTLKDDPFTVFPFYATPSTSNPSVTVSGLPLPLPKNGPSYPVYIDPIGVKLTASTVGAKFSPAGGPLFPVYNNPQGISLGSIPRVCPSFMNLAGSFQDLERWCIMTDDIQFQENGKPLLAGGGSLVQRENRYSWAWLCRQRQNYAGTPPTPRGIATTVVVYDRRPFTIGPSGAPAGETVCSVPAGFSTTANTVTLTWTSSVPPNLRPGTWILDATLQPLVGSPPVVASPNGYFYRVVNTPVISGNTATVELHTFPRANSGANGVAVIMEGVAEVYEP